VGQGTSTPFVVHKSGAADTVVAGIRDINKGAIIKNTKTKTVVNRVFLRENIVLMLRE